MLTRLQVRDLVVIPALEIEFGPGLTVITGESGAGKSVLLDALGLALGARASADRIRRGAQRAESVAEFRVEAGSECARYLEERQLADPDEPGRCVARRTVDRRGRSHAFVNDTPVTRATLAGLGDTLLDVHAQGEAMRIARKRVQLALLDDYGVPVRKRRRLADAWDRWRRAVREMEALEAEQGNGGDAAALLDYQLRELEELDPQPGEYEAIDAEHSRLSQIDALRESAARALAALEDVDSLRSAASEIGRLEGDDPSLASAQENADSALALIDGALSDLRRYAERLAPDPERLAELDARIGRMHDIARKHRTEPARLPEIHASIADRVAAREASSERRDTLSAEIGQREEAYRAAALEVRKTRRKAADAFGRKVGRLMKTLGIAGGSLSVAFSEALNERGLDAVEFLVATNPDQPPASLARVASGGEQARISLAVTVVAAERSALPCLVLDEADIGVGGVTADTVGRTLRRLAGRAQVVCVTHAPQVAALGNRHLSVSRESGSDVSIAALTREERIEEIARMLSGARITERARENARDLLDGDGQESEVETDPG